MKSMLKAFVGAFAGRILAAVFLAAAALLGFGPPQWLTWFLSGHELIAPAVARWAFVIVSIPVAIYVLAPLYIWLQMLRQKPPWADRDRLELHAIVSLAAGRPISTKVNVDPQLSWLRMLKDAIGAGELVPVNLDMHGANVMTQVTRVELRRFADRHGHEWLQRFLSLWEKWASPFAVLSNVTTGTSDREQLGPRANDQKIAERVATEDPKTRYSVHLHTPGHYRLEIPYAQPEPDAPLMPSYVKFRPQGMELVASSNVSSVTDNGGGDFTIAFVRPLDPEKIVVLPIGSTPRSIKVMETSSATVRIVIEGPEPETVGVKFET